MRVPAALPAISLVAGICLGAEVPLPIRHIALSSLVLAWLAAVLAFTSERSTTFAAAIGIGFALAGVAMGQGALTQALRPTLLTLLEQQPGWGTPDYERQPVEIEGRLDADASASPMGVSLSLRIDHVQADGHSWDVEGGALISVAGDGAARRSDEWRAGRRLRMPAALRPPTTYLNPGVRDERRALALRGTAVVGSVKSGLLVQVVSKGSWTSEASALGRRAVRRTIDRHVGQWSPRSAGIVTAILIGDRASLDPDVERRLQEAGTYHVIAISGGNIAILAGTVFLVLTACGARDRRAAVIPIAVLVMYAVLVGGGASVMRATLMAVVYLVARMGDQRTAPLNAVALALVLILCANPLAIFDAGAALTFGATIGILIGAQPLATRLSSRRWLRPVTGLLGASLAAEAVVCPIGAYAFGRVTVAGPAMNLLAVPLMALTQMAGSLAVVVAVVPVAGPLATARDWLAGLAGYAAHLGAAGLIESTRVLDVAPWLARRLPPPSLWALALYFAALLIWLLARSRARRLGTAAVSERRLSRASAVVAVMAALWMLLVMPSPYPMSHGRLSVVFMDVGQGDAILIGFPNGRSMLVDAGGAPGATRLDFGSRVVVPAIWARGLARLDTLVISHGDPDHIGGATGVLRDLRPREIWEGIEVPGHRPTRDLRSLAESQRSTWRSLLKGSQREVGGVELRVWHPPTPDWERQRVRNDDSLVIEATYGAVSVVLTGDIGRDIERDLAGVLRRSTLRVLKVPHHGSLTSSSEAFLRALQPAIAVVSAGRDNRYGHPADEVVARYGRVGAALFRTDTDGAVTITTDGVELLVETFRRKTSRFIAPRAASSPSSTPLPAPRASVPADGVRSPPVVARFPGSVR